MCEKPDHRNLRLIGGGRNRTEDVAVLVHGGILDTDLLELVDQLAQKVELARSAGERIGILLGLGVNRDVVQKALHATRLVPGRLHHDSSLGQDSTIGGCFLGTRQCSRSGSTVTDLFPTRRLTGPIRAS